MKQSFCVILSFFLLLVASKKANSSEIIEFVDFNFESFRNVGPLIQLQGAATTLRDGSVRLTNPESSAAGAGRVLYAPTVRLWDTASGSVASFVTTFSLQITDIPNFVPADGIIFFIAPENTRIPSGTVVGGGLGVANLRGVGQFVGVEFDNHVNPEYNDPPYSHVGINVNSVNSSKTVEWNSVSGSEVRVTVIYDSSSKTLSVAVRNNNVEIITISEVVDLKEKLPARVKFGFSAASSLGGRQLHVIRSWSFTSTLRRGSSESMITNNGTNIKYVSNI